jgi:hypothetical protein
LNNDNNSSTTIVDQARQIASELIDERLKPLRNRRKRNLQLEKNKSYDGRDIVILSENKKKIQKKKELQLKKKRDEKEQRRISRFVKKRVEFYHSFLEILINKKNWTKKKRIVASYVERIGAVQESGLCASNVIISVCVPAA